MQICVDPGPLRLLVLAAERRVISAQSVAVERGAEKSSQEGRGEGAFRKCVCCFCAPSSGKVAWETLAWFPWE